MSDPVGLIKEVEALVGEILACNRQIERIKDRKLAKMNQLHGKLALPRDPLRDEDALTKQIMKIDGARIVARRKKYVEWAPEILLANFDALGGPEVVDLNPKVGERKYKEIVKSGDKGKIEILDRARFVRFSETVLNIQETKS